MQHIVLLATSMNNCSHGPYRSGRNKQVLEESARNLAQKLTDSDFQELLDNMSSDRGYNDDQEEDDPNLPTDPHEIPSLSCIKNLPEFVSCTSISPTCSFATYDTWVC